MNPSNKEKPFILIVEDDDAVQLGLSTTFEDENFRVLTAATGEQGYSNIVTKCPDVVILDIMLPGMSGFELLKKLRDRGDKTPVLILTARDDDTDKIVGLELGADDYVTKPFNAREVLARVRALLRRSEYHDAAEQPAEKSTSFQFGDVLVDFDKHEVKKSGKPVELSHREFRLLEYLIENKGRMITRDRLLDDVWEYDSYVTTRTIDNHILRLRRKIEDEAENPKFIQTIRGYGYKFVAE